MPLLLTIENAGSFAEELQTEFLVNDRPITIGRGREADWQLPDTSRFLSTIHCEIGPDSGLFRLSDRSRNGIAVNGEFMPVGDSRMLLGGERLQLGPFSIMARLRGDDASFDHQSEPDAERTVILGAKARPPEAKVTERSPLEDMEKTRLPARASAAAALSVEPDVMRPRVAQPTPLVAASQPADVARPRAAANPRSSAGTADFVAEFARGAGIDPDWLAGRTDAEFARSIGRMVRLMAPTLAGLARSKGQIRKLAGSGLADEEFFSGSDDEVLRALLAPPDGSPEESLELLETALADLADHDEALFASLQTALFRLLNALSPITVEQSTRTGLIRRKSARNWDAYGALWEDMSDAGPNGMLDMLLRYFREAYDGKFER